MDNNTPLYGTVSYCHKSPSLIVRSRQQGFVTQNCLECGEPRSLPFDDLPNLSCEGCDLELKRFINERKNYAYACDRCGISFELASLVPHWNKRFEYHGFALDSDYLFAYGSAPSVIYLNVNGIPKKRSSENH
jgi:predicted nucleic acid-binding Zn ribbon protein